MSNVIKIKHGSNPPAAGVLEEYELGYSSSNDGLYLGQGQNEPIHLNDSGGVVVSSSTPTNTKVLWINEGVAKYYDPVEKEWVVIPAVWG